MTAHQLHVRVGLWGAARVQPLAALPPDLQPGSRESGRAG